MRLHKNGRVVKVRPALRVCLLGGCAGMPGRGSVFFGKTLQAKAAALK